MNEYNARRDKRFLPSCLLPPHPRIHTASPAVRHDARPRAADGSDRTLPAHPSSVLSPSDGAAAAAAQQILKAHAAGDFFACLSLPRPDCDDAGAPVWAVTEGAIAKAFRKASLAVHPDKNPDRVAEAKEAFDKLSDANRALKDPVRRVGAPPHD